MNIQTKTYIYIYVYIYTYIYIYININIYIYIHIHVLTINMSSGPTNRWGVKDHFHVAGGPGGPASSCDPSHQGCVVPPCRTSPFWWPASWRFWFPNPNPKNPCMRMCICICACVCVCVCVYVYVHVYPPLWNGLMSRLRAPS